MTVSGFSYVRNGLQYGYPFLESIKSVLPLCDEFIMVVGDSTDGTRQAIENLNDPKIKIVDSIWPAQNEGGRRYAIQANIGLDHCTGDWAFHIQADEVIHEKDHAAIAQAMKDHFNNKKVEGFLFKFINFFGDYWHWGPSRRFHQHEIRIVRNSPKVRSYKDSQGFRIYEDPANQWNEKGRKLNVVPIDATVYHYSHARNPFMQRKRQIEFEKGYFQDEVVEKKFAEIKHTAYDYTNIDYLEKFNGTHPAIMNDRIKNQDWEFHYDPKAGNMKLKEKFLKLLHDLTGKQFFIYKNYRIVRP